MEPDNKRGMRL